MESRLAVVMSQMSLINLIEPGGRFYNALPRVYVAFTLISFGRTNFSFISLKFQVTVYMRIANLSRLEAWVTLARGTIFRAFYQILII